MRIEQIPQVELDGVSGITMAPLNAGTSAERVKIDLAVLQPGSSLPKHPAGREQVFYVVSGSGRVAGDDDVEHPISAGWAAVWDRGERHTSWADSMMTVLIIQRRPDAG
ncbi:MAG: cupin domain-containing protein [Actinobacteria bacterium]|jgi:quercetin dioxygenase-like cupin family protein|nr:cupin domain-containing protein [Actinomycetota bacterium]